MYPRASPSGSRPAGAKQLEENDGLEICLGGKRRIKSVNASGVCIFAYSVKHAAALMQITLNGGDGIR